MKFSFSRFLVFTLAATLFIVQSQAQVVEIPDPNLKQAVREALKLPDEIRLTQLEMLRLKNLHKWDSNINDLTGLEHATFLKHLNLHGNKVYDLTPIVELVNMETLELGFNQIADISQLANLTNLTYLGIGGNGKIDDISPLANMTKLERINMWGNLIEDLTPLQHLTEIWELVANNNKIRDITPLANLTNLRELRLDRNQVQDIGPLASLISLEELQLNSNQIVDFSPLANLVNLEVLWIQHNPGIDFTPLQGLNLTKFQYDQVCDIDPILPPVQERIENRAYPSVFQIWLDVAGQDHLTSDERSALHDLQFSPLFGLHWDPTSPGHGEHMATQFAGDVERARQTLQQRRSLNPNMVFLVSFAIHERPGEKAFPPGSDFWLRDGNGEIVRKETGEPLSDFLKPEVQELIVNRILAVAQCGLFDGVFLDGFAYNGTGFVGRLLYPYTDEEIIQAYLNIFSAVRSQVRDDFLILINTNETKPTRFKEYVNGIYMETHPDYPGGYTHGGLHVIESTLSWAEENLREPRINCLPGEDIGFELPDSPNNRRWMRVFTTMSLTHSDGYVTHLFGLENLQRMNPPHWLYNHLWHSFWEADLGRSIGDKAQLYQDINGLFIREFTNGWAVYNRSGKAQTVTLPRSATPVSDRGDNSASLTHQLPDLDGEIYLKIPNPFDLNKDTIVNVLDLILVSQYFGTAKGDVNGDGTTNILDLTLVAQQFSQ